MTLSRRQRARQSLYRWATLGVLALIAVGLVFPARALMSPDSILARYVLTDQNCRSFVRQALPLLGVHLSADVPAMATVGDSGDARGLVAWAFRAITGVSLGEPSSFLSANLPLARSSYAGAIIASGRLASGSDTDGTTPGSAGTPGSGSDAADAGAPAQGGGLYPGSGTDSSTGDEGESPGSASGSETDATAGDGVLEDQNAQLYLYGGDDPVIAIVHTHSSESFLPVVKAMALADDPNADLSKIDSFTTDNSSNMLRIGEELARYLSAEYGIASVQSRRIHDRQEDGFRLGAYERSLETMTQIVRMHPTVKIMIDLHRDAPEHDKTTAVIDGVSTATICAVVGTDQLLENPIWQTNYDFARRLTAKMESLYPGLSRGILVRSERYNQHVMERTLLLEVGGQENTLEEEFAAVHCLGDVLAQILSEGF